MALHFSLNYNALQISAKNGRNSDILNKLFTYTCHIYAYPQLPYIIRQLDYIAREAKNDWKMAVRHQHSPNMVVTVNAKYSIKCH